MLELLPYEGLSTRTVISPDDTLTAYMPFFKNKTPRTILHKDFEAVKDILTTTVSFTRMDLDTGEFKKIVYKVPPKNVRAHNAHQHESRRSLIQIDLNLLQIDVNLRAAEPEFKDFWWHVVTSHSDMSQFFLERNTAGMNRAYAAGSIDKWDWGINPQNYRINKHPTPHITIRQEII